MAGLLSALFGGGGEAPPPMMLDEMSSQNVMPPSVGGLGGLGGIGVTGGGGLLGDGSDMRDRLRAVFMSMASSPANNPFQNLPAMMAASQKQGETRAAQAAMAQALSTIGIDPSLAAMVARNPEAAKLIIEHKNRQEQDKLFQQGFGDMFAQTGQPQEQPAAAPASVPTPQPSPFANASPTTDTSALPTGAPGPVAGMESAPSWLPSAVPTETAPVLNEPPAMRLPGQQAPQPQAPVPATSAPKRPDIITPAQRDQVRRLGFYVAHPRAPAGLKDLAKLQLQSILDDQKLTSDQKEYLTALSQGYGGNFVDYQKMMKEAGRSQVNIDQRGESAFSQAAGGIQAKRFDELAGEGPKANQMLSDVRTLTELGARIQTGKIAEVKSAIGPFAEALGVPIKGLNEIQAYEAIVNRVAPNLRVPGTGAQSDYELKNFLKSIPSLGNTPEGNAIIARTLEGLYANKLEAARIGANALSGKMQRGDAEDALRALPDPMKEWREYSKASAKPADDKPAAARPRAQHPQTGAVVEWDGSKWVPVK